MTNPTTTIVNIHNKMWALDDMSSRCDGEYLQRDSGFGGESYNEDEQIHDTT